MIKIRDKKDRYIFKLKEKIKEKKDVHIYRLTQNFKNITTMSLIFFFTIVLVYYFLIFTIPDSTGDEEKYSIYGSVNNNSIQLKSIESKFDSIKNDISILFNKILEIQSIQNQTMNDITYRLEIEKKKNNVKIKSIVTQVIEKQKNELKYSKIITEQNRLDLIGICEFSNEQRWQLIYCGSRDGFGSKDFHNKCDGVKNTLTIMKAKNNNVFGGYTNKPWSSTVGWVRDQDAFLFSIVNNKNAPFKAKCSQPHFAICCNPSYGPCFGFGYETIFGNDLHISNNSNTTNNYCYFGNSYKFKNYGYQEFAGDKKFQLSEIEVYKKL